MAELIASFKNSHNGMLWSLQLSIKFVMFSSFISDNDFGMRISKKLLTHTFVRLGILPAYVCKIKKKKTFVYLFDYIFDFSRAFLQNSLEWTSAICKGAYVMINAIQRMKNQQNEWIFAFVSEKESKIYSESMWKLDKYLKNLKCRFNREIDEDVCKKKKFWSFWQN